MNGLLTLLFALQSGAQPLPDQIDIPEGHSTVICPDQPSAKLMFEQYHGVEPAPNNHIIDTDRFFEGLKATGCKQERGDAGAITIKTVLQRKELKLANSTERYVRYSGVDASGKTVAGIVDEESNNGFARSPVAEWLVGRSEDGWIDARGDIGNLIFYRCDTPEKADAAVKAVQGRETENDKAFLKRLEKAAAQQGCRKASDRYFILGLLSKAGNECGFECYVDLTALEARNRAGQRIGLIYDGSLM
jgi:hypothetical protein